MILQKIQVAIVMSVVSENGFDEKCTISMAIEVLEALRLPHYSTAFCKTIYGSAKLAATSPKFRRNHRL